MKKLFGPPASTGKRGSHAEGAQKRIAQIAHMVTTQKEEAIARTAKEKAGGGPSGLRIMTFARCAEDL